MGEEFHGAELDLYIVHGQSNADGSRATPLVGNINPYPDRCLKLADIDLHLGRSGLRSRRTEAVDLSNVVDFDPLLESVARAGNGQTVSLAAATTLARLAEDAGIDLRTCWASTGVSGVGIEDLNKGTAPYANCVAVVQKVCELAARRGWRVRVSVVWRHGENPRVAPTTTYQTLLRQLQRDFDTDVRALQMSHLGAVQAEPVLFYCIQQSSWTSSNICDPWVAVNNLTASSPEAFACVGPAPMEKHLWFTGDAWPYLHYTAIGQARTGEILGHYIFDRLKYGSARTPLQVSHATLQSGDDRLVTTWTLFNGPLTFDTETLPEVENTALGVMLRDVAEDRFIRLTDPVISASGNGTLVKPVVTFTAPTIRRGDPYILHIGTARSRRTPESFANCVNIRGASMGNSMFDGEPLYDWATHQYMDITGA